MSDETLPTRRAAALDSGDSNGTFRWRIDQVWGEGVGILGGPPKCAKSWFGLDMAISLASATPFLGHFAVRDPGSTLVLAQLDMHVITAPAVRLDQAPDQKRLAATLESLHPKLLLLDPLVRLHRLDENSSADISALLGYLRELQRRYDVAIVVVHHMRKAVRAHLGQALRGSGDLYAWTDHAAYLTRLGPGGERLRLTLEHRAAPALEPLELRLVSSGDGSATHLEVVSSAVSSSRPDIPPAHAPGLALDERVVKAIIRAGHPLSRVQLRDVLRVNNNRLGDALNNLERSGRINRSDAGITVLA